MPGQFGPNKRDPPVYADELDEPEYDKADMTELEIEYGKRIRLFKQVFGFELENVTATARYSITLELLPVAVKIARRYSKKIQ